MSGIIVRGDFPIFMQPNPLQFMKKKVWDQATDTLEQMKGDYYNVESTTDPFWQTFGTVGLGNAFRKPETTPVRYDAPRLGRPFTVVFPAYALAVAISREAQADDKANQLVPMITKELRRSMIETMEEDAVAQYNDGFSVVGWETDGVALFSAAHPILRPGPSGLTVGANKSTTDAALSITALDAAYTDLRTTQNDTGRWMPGMMPKYLDVHPALLPYAQQIVGTSRVLGSNYNDKNLYYQQIEVRANPRFTRRTQWSLQAEKHSWVWFNREKPDLITDVDYINGVTILMTYARWGRGAVDWRGKWASYGP